MDLNGTSAIVTGGASGLGEATARLLAERGVHVFKEEHRRTGTFQGRSAYFHDPDRNVLEIIDLARGPVAEGDA